MLFFFKLNEALTNAFDALNTIKSGGKLEGGAAPSTPSEDKPAAEEKPAAPAQEFKTASAVTIDDVMAAAPEVLAEGDSFEEVAVEAKNVKFVHLY